MKPAPRVSIELPEALVLALETDAKEMNLSLPGYIEYLRQRKLAGFDAKTDDATRFVLTNHAESLRKLADSGDK